MPARSYDDNVRSRIPSCRRDVVGRSVVSHWRVVSFILSNSANNVAEGDSFDFLSASGELEEGGVKAQRQKLVHRQAPTSKSFASGL